MHYVDALMQRLDTLSSSGPVSINDWFNSTIFDIAGALIFGEDFACLSEGRLHPWIGLLFISIKTLVYTFAVKSYPELEWLLMKMVPRSLLRKQMHHFNLTAAKVDRRIAMGAEKPDLMSGVLKNGFSEKHGQKRPQKEDVLSRDELHANAYM